MDPFEEFEFKPLTEGLGFHKKKAQPAKSATDFDSSFEVTKPGASLNTATGMSLLEEEAIDPLRSPLPRKPTTAPIADPEATSTSTAVDEILKTLQKNRRLDFEAKPAAKISAPVTPKKSEYKPDVWNFSSALLDGMLVMAATLLCLIILLTVTKADLISSLGDPQDGGMIYLSMLALVSTVTFVYLTVNRMFAGSTPGEWAFEQRIGQPEELKSYKYSLRVFARSLLVIATGFIIFPIASMIMKKDLAGEITGAKLLKKV